jgi:hypothetical protein
LHIISALRWVLALQEDVRVRVDEAGKNCSVREIDDVAGARLGAGIWPHALNPVAADHNHLVAQGRRRTRVNDNAGPDHGDGLISLRFVLRNRDRRQQ